MKNAFLVLLMMIGSTTFAATPEFHVYLRSGAGSNLKGGAQDKIQNSGVSANNEFRLGNEPETYGEFGLGVHLLEGANDSAPFWRLFSNFAFSYPNSTDWEAGTGNQWVLREIYTEGGNFDGMGFSVWAGKRFYRWGDILIDDFFAVDMSGPGGGLGGLKIGSGTLMAAIIQNTKSDDFTGGPVVPTEIGRAAKTSLHLRFEDFKSDYGNWSAWLVGAITPSTKSVATPAVDYKGTSGGFLAVKNNSHFGSSNNEIAVAYGQGNMSSMRSDGDLVQDCSGPTSGATAACTVSASSRIRAWDSITTEGDTWSTQAAIIYEDLNRGTDQNSHVRWASLGVRPVRWMTEHTSLAFEAGISNVVDEADGNGSRNLMRMTIAPQLQLAKGFYQRPVIRAYYTRSMWNDHNKSSVPTPYQTQTSVDSIGMQTEVWF